MNIDIKDETHHVSKSRILETLFNLSFVLMFLGITINGNISTISFLIMLGLAAAFLQHRPLRGMAESRPSETFSNRQFIITIFFFPLLATAVAQILRKEIFFEDFEAPFRVALAGTLALLVARPLIERHFYKLLSISLMTGSLAIFLFGEHTWNGRLFVPSMGENSLGCLSGALALLSFGLCCRRERNSTFFNLINFFAGVFYLGHLFFTFSRSFWLSFLLVLTLNIFIFAGRSFYKFLVSSSLIIAFGVLLASFPYTKKLYFTHHTRIHSTWTDLVHFYNNPESNSSVAARVKMWAASYHLFKSRPIAGYGGTSYSEVVNKSYFIQGLGSEVVLQMGGTGGPHNELLAKGLRDGLFGLLSATWLLVGPTLFFFYQRRKSFCALVGLNFTIYLIIASNFIEIYSLKHLTTFYSTIIAILIARVCIENSRHPLSRGESQ